MRGWMVHERDILSGAFGEVFSRISNTFFVISLSAGVFIFLSLWKNMRMLGTIIVDPGVSIESKLLLTLSLVKGAFTAASPLSVLMLMAFSFLVGLNVTCAWYLSRMRKGIRKGELALSAGGVLSGVAGAGCLACGSLIMNLSFLLTGSAGVLSFLPLQGKEFGLIGIILLVVSLLMVLRQIHKGNTCSI